MGVVIEHLYIEIGIWGLEVKHVILRVAKPILPTDVPSLHKHLIKTMLGSEINIFLHILIIGWMLTVRFGLGIVKSLKFHRRRIKSV